MKQHSQEHQPPIQVLHPAPDEVQQEWQKRIKHERLASRYAPPLEAMPQWELEAHLGRLIEQALSARDHAEVAEMKALKARWDEAEALEAISECRRCLGLADGPIGRSGGRDDDA